MSRLHPVRHPHLFVIACCLATLATAQDTVQAPVGNTLSGTAFDQRAPADRRIGSLTANTNPALLGLLMGYEQRSGTATGASSQIGTAGGVSANFVIADEDYLATVDVWYDPTTILAVALETKNGLRQEFGPTTAGTLHHFTAPLGDEIVGLVGTDSGVLRSLGVVTRPAMASHHFFGTACPTTAGTPQMRYRTGFSRLILGTTPILEVTAVPVGQLAIVAIGLSTLATAGIPLPMALAAYGAPGCSIYVSLDALQFCARDPNGTAGLAFPVPNNSSLTGLPLSFQGFVPGAANAANLAASSAMTCMIGAL